MKRVGGGFMSKKRLNSKKKGMRREREARKIAEKEGYYVCPAKGSLGLWDFVAIPKDKNILHGLPRVIQVASNKIYGEKREKLAAFEIVAEKEVWVKRDYREWIRLRWNSTIQKWELI